MGSTARRPYTRSLQQVETSNAKFCAPSGCLGSRMAHRILRCWSRPVGASEYMAVEQLIPLRKGSARTDSHRLPRGDRGQCDDQCGETRKRAPMNTTRG